MADEQTPDRRGFALRALGFLAALFGLPGLAVIADPVLRSATRTWLDVAAAGDLKPGEPKAFSYEVQSGWERRREAGFLLRHGEQLLAFSARCTHLGCKVRHKKGEFVCPCHGGKFDLQGRPTHKPVTESLVRMETREHNGKIQVRA